MSYATNAISAKARAMYGKRLTPHDYNEMIKQQSVTQVAEYLAHNTIYAEALKELNLHDIHRGQLEAKLRDWRFETFDRLARFSFASEDSFYSYLYMREELDQIISMIRFISSGSQEDYYYHCTPLMEEHASFPIKKLFACRDYTSLVDVLQGTPYGAVLAKYPPDADGKIDLVMLERDLKEQYYRKMFAVIHKGLGGKQANTLTSMVEDLIDCENVVNAYRLKKFFKSSAKEIECAMLPYGRSSSKIVPKIIAAENDSELSKVMSEWNVAKGKTLDSDYIESVVQREKEKTSRKMMRYSTSPAVVLLCYMNEREIELENIINIVEGVRYGLSPTEIRKLLILQEI